MGWSVLEARSVCDGDGTSARKRPDEWETVGEKEVKNSNVLFTVGRAKTTRVLPSYANERRSRARVCV